MKKLMPKGFTIIEVIIVLVIGATIMIAVFLVVPQLQQTARNNQRRNDIQRVLVAARQYYATNAFRDTSSGGGTDGVNIKNIISSNFKDPSLSSNSTTSRDYVIKPRTTTRTGVVTWIEIFYDKKCVASQSSSQLNGNLQDSTGSITVTLDVEPIKPTIQGGNYYGSSHYCVND